MPDRYWFFAVDGKQHGPYPESQFRDFLARGVVRADTLVWTEGMASWQRAGEVPGLLAGAPSRPPSLAQSASPLTAGGGRGGALSIDLDLWSFLGRGLLFVIGILLVVPAPWVATSFYRWIVSRLNVPGRPNLAFNGQVGDLWYVFVLLGLFSYAGAAHSMIVQLASIVIQAFLAWMILRWLAASLSSNGEPLPIAFKGSAWAYIGWEILLYVSAITIIGWAWVLTAWIRWICRNVSGTRHEIAFNASGLDILWRTIVFALGCAVIIPIPWVLRWYVRWYVSQFELVDRSSAAQA